VQLFQAFAVPIWRAGSIDDFDLQLGEIIPNAFDERADPIDCTLPSCPALDAPHTLSQAAEFR
jgi:hypothetical protein